MVICGSYRSSCGAPKKALFVKINKRKFDSRDVCANVNHLCKAHSPLLFLTDINVETKI